MIKRYFPFAGSKMRSVRIGAELETSCRNNVQMIHCYGICMESYNAHSAVAVYRYIIKSSVHTFVNEYRRTIVKCMWRAYCCSNKILW